MRLLLEGMDGLESSRAHVLVTRQSIFEKRIHDCRYDCTFVYTCLKSGPRATIQSNESKQSGSFV